MNASEAIDEIDSWFKKMTNDEWEHHNGVTIESSDNPGWILSIDLPKNYLDNSSRITNLIKKLPNVEGGIFEGKLRIYSPDLAIVITASGLLLKAL